MTLGKGKERKPASCGVRKSRRLAGELPEVHEISMPKTAKLQKDVEAGSNKSAAVEGRAPSSTKAANESKDASVNKTAPVIPAPSDINPVNWCRSRSGLLSAPVLPPEPFTPRWKWWPSLLIFVPLDKDTIRIHTQCLSSTGMKYKYAHWFALNVDQRLYGSAMTNAGKLSRHRKLDRSGRVPNLAKGKWVRQSRYKAVKKYMQRILESKRQSSPLIKPVEPWSSDDEHAGSD